MAAANFWSRNLALLCNCVPKFMLQSREGFPLTQILPIAPRKGSSGALKIVLGLNLLPRCYFVDSTKAEAHKRLRTMADHGLHMCVRISHFLRSKSSGSLAFSHSHRSKSAVPDRAHKEICMPDLRRIYQTTDLSVYIEKVCKLCGR